MSGLTKRLGRGRGGRGGVTVIASDWVTSIPDENFRAALEAEGITSLALLAAATTIDLTAYDTLTGANWNGIQNADALEVLNLTNTGMVGDLSLVGQCTTLTELRMYGTNPTNGLCSELAGLTNLTYLNMGNSGLGGDIADLAPLTAMQDLTLRLTSVTGNISVYSNFPNLIDTHMSDLAGVVGDLGVFNNCPDLEKAYFYNTGVNAATSPAFQSQANLATLWLHNANLAQAAVDTVLADCETSLGLAGRVTCDLRLDGNAAPSATGDTDQDALEAAGWTVQTDASGGGGTPTAILTFEVQDPPPALTTEQQKWRDRIYSSANTQNLDDFPVATGDDMRRHNNIRYPLIGLTVALAATKDKAFLEWIDTIGEALWDTLDYGFRSTDSNPDWNDGEHDLQGDAKFEGLDCLIFVTKNDWGSTDYPAGSGSWETEGTNLGLAHAVSRWMSFCCLVMEIYRQNAAVSLPASAQRTRTSKETSAPPDKSGVTLSGGTETTYGDRFDRWKWWTTHHALPELNRRIEKYESWGTGRSLYAPWAVEYSKGKEKSSYASAIAPMLINYYLWKATSDTQYEDAAKELTDWYMDVAHSPITTDLGRPGVIKPRGFRERDEIVIGYDGGFCWSGYLQPTDYYQEHTSVLALLQITGWYRFSNDSFLRRVHHTMADHVMSDSVTGETDGIPVDFSWVFGTDLGGHRQRRSGWVRPDTQEVITLESCQDGYNENICQSFSQQGLSRLHDAPLLTCLPWRDSGALDTRLRSIAQGAYDVSYSGSSNPDKIGVASSMLLDAVINGL